MVVTCQGHTAEEPNQDVGCNEGRSSGHIITKIMDPLIVLAPMRSYSTLVTAMLGQHPQMYALLETHLFLFDTVRRWWLAFGGTVFSHGLLRAIAELIMGHQSESTVALARLWILQRLNWSTTKLFHLLAERVNPAVLIDKSPLIVNHPKSLQRVLVTFPATRFLHLTRHPLGFGKSYLRFFADYSVPVTVDPQMVWLRQHSTILRFLQAVSPERQLRIKGEDLIADPDRHLRRIAHWLGVRADQVAIERMKHPEKSPFAGFGPINALGGGGDPKFFCDPKLHRSRLTNMPPLGSLPWRRDGARFTPQVLSLVHRFGYQ